jgi:hypothetical protein
MIKRSSTWTQETADQDSAAELSRAIGAVKLSVSRSFKT